MPDALLPKPVIAAPSLAWRGLRLGRAGRVLAAEVPVAFSYNHAGHAVMMATPDALEDFATGFSLTEGIVDEPAEIESVETLVLPPGIELRIGIPAEREDRLVARRRRLAGPMGCGLCGIETLAEVTRPIPPLPLGHAFHAHWVAHAVTAMADAQALNHLAHSLHAAGLWQPGGGLMALREDVGRHNALDKLCGAVARLGLDPIGGAVVLTSRVSVEMVQKAAVLGCPVLIAVSAPTSLAVHAAQECGMTLVAVARGEEFEVFSGEERLLG